MTQLSTQGVIKGARDILVGKVPMPMEQCHEITKALIYKFISAWDRRSEKKGFAPTYFLGQAAEYRWDQLLDMRLSATELARRYRAGLAYIGGRTDIPQAFQSIYRDAFLPYDDAPTLRAFLEKVNEFKTKNTEAIGDAFEHLLRDTGAQGKAGQFRTPRHIIDFIVGIINPQSSETILDPACGTGGFLAAAWQHIQRQEGAEFSNPVQNRLAANLVGYDLSPDMVKLATIHLFLQHGRTPRIEVYDTISHDRLWNDHYDVILANPPFMTPAGIIQPHSRFYTQAGRTEVLFVDYIASHLTTNGRAGVIVPEGIIFRNGGPHKQLRRLLVDNYLAAVISLPAGVFKPYSDIKTSILIMDKGIAARSNTIAFFKVEQDGFDLGAQRRPIDRDDLPRVAAELAEYQRRLRAGASLADWTPQTGLVVSKKQLAAAGDYNLSGERYRETSRPAGQWPLVSLGEVCELYQPKTITQKELVEDGDYLVFGANSVIGRYDRYNHEDAEVMVGCRGTCGTVNMSEPRSWITGNAMVVTPKDHRILKGFLYHLLKGSDLGSTVSGSAQPQITRQSLAPFQIPLPPLSVQQEIVAEVAGYERVIAEHKSAIVETEGKIQNAVAGVWTNVPVVV